MSAKPNILVTGASGFVGQSLCPYLEETGFSVIKVGRNANELSYAELDSSKLSNSKALIHLAGKAHDLKNVSDESAYFKVNRDLTIELYDKFLKSSAQTFIFISSVKAIADELKDELSEDFSGNPQTAYGKSKLEAEQYLLSNLPETDKRVFILRPCMIHGPGNKGNLNLLYGLIDKGIPYPFGAFKNRRSFLSIENLCFVINKLVNTGLSLNNEVFNVADSGSMSTVDLVKLISNESGRESRVLRLPKFFVRVLGKLGNVLPLPVNEEKIRKLTENYVVSNSKIKRMLETEFPVTLEEGLRKTVQSFKGLNS